MERLDAEERGDGFVLDGTSSEESSESERSMERSEDSDRTHPKNKQEQSEEVEVETESQKQRLSTEKHESLKIMKKLVLLKQIFKKVQENCTCTHNICTGAIFILFRRAVLRSF